MLKHLNDESRESRDERRDSNIIAEKDTDRCPFRSLLSHKISTEPRLGGSTFHAQALFVLLHEGIEAILSVASRREGLLRFKSHPHQKEEPP